MSRTSLAAVVLLAFGSGVDAQALDMPPSAPGSPVGRAYGPTSGGIAWQRSTDDRAVAGYEITRDGTVIGVRDSLSYVADDLQPGRGYNFAIVAIDSAGQRSARASVRIETPDARPNPPGGLLANVYSATAAGIKWDRSGVFGERYTVKRDGEIVLATTNATSYVDTSLTGRRPYLFEVIAINRQGERSTAARLFVQTSGDTGPPPTAGPAAPGGLRAVVYSGMAGAIAWERSSTPGMRYEIARDGQIVGITDGTSYIDDRLTGGQSYSYEVIAINRSGRRSSASSAILTTPGQAAPPTNPFATTDPSGTTTIARLGYPAARDVAHELVSAGYLNLYLDIDDTLGSLADDSVAEAVDGVVERVFDCLGGGSARGQIVPFRVADLELDDCIIEERMLSGRLERSLNRFPTGAGSVRQIEITFAGLRVDAGAAGVLTLDGTFARSDAEGASGVCDRFESTTDTVRIDSARLERDGAITDISDATYTQTNRQQDFGEPGREGPCRTVQTLEFEGTATAVSTRFMPGIAMITTQADGSIGPDGFWGDATLSANFGDRSTLVVSSVPDREPMVQADIVSDGVAVSFDDGYEFAPRMFDVSRF